LTLSASFTPVEGSVEPHVAQEARRSTAMNNAIDILPKSPGGLAGHYDLFAVLPLDLDS